MRIRIQTWFGNDGSVNNQIYTVPVCTVKHCFGFVFIDTDRSGSGSSILGWSPIGIQGFNDQKLQKNLQIKKIYLDQKQSTHNLPIPRPPERTPKLQKEPSALKKRTSSTSKHEISLFFYLFLWVPESGSRIQIRIRIHWHDFFLLLWVILPTGIRIRDPLSHWPDWSWFYSLCLCKDPQSLPAAHAGPGAGT